VKIEVFSFPSRRRRFAAYLTLIWAAAGSAAFGALYAQPVPPPQASGYKLAFTDEFDSLDLSPDGAGMHTWYEGMWFSHQHSPLSNISVSSSVLSLAWHRNQGSSDTSIETLAHDGGHFQAWRYGYFEARMKWDAVKGAWPAFWLLPVEDATGADVHNGQRESGEMDVFEGSGETPHAYYGTIHRWLNGKEVAANKKNRFQVSEEVDYSEFHTYGLLWLPGTVTWYLDNLPLHSEKTYDIFDKEQYSLVFSMQEGVNWKPGDTSGLQKDKLTLNVDWVRVWQK
jgi:hypothetical protein